MCGILGVVSAASPLLSEPELDRWRQALAQRGPDGSGVFRDERVILAHSRLAVRDLRDGAQPMTSADGRWVLVYNGELYNDAELRAELSPAGGWRTRCDTETVLAALEKWGQRAPQRLRGMFAFVAYDTRTQHVMLARDPLGLKPLYWWCDGEQLVFGSEPRTVLAHPDVPVLPDLNGISAYLTTIRTTLGEATLFDGVRSLRPGAALHIALGTERLSPLVTRYHRPAPVEQGRTLDEASEELRVALGDSVRLHLEADVPVALMLSGGLDSAVLAALGTDHALGLRAYTAGSRCEVDGDLAHGGALADRLGLVQTRCMLDESTFVERWHALVTELGVPLSTPNEVAIHAVAERMRADGQVVALSGEGADELLAGYGCVLDAAAAFCAERPAGLSGGRFQLEAGAWISPAIKGEVFSEVVWESLSADAALIAEYERTFERCAEEVGPAAEPLDAHLRFQRHMNLTGLLQRLDTATMLASIEGRAPFADVELLRLCESFPMSVKYAARVPVPTSAAPEIGAPRTKLALRRAFAGRVPSDVLDRPKASFPLPFQRWIANQGHVLRNSPFANVLFDAQTLEVVSRDPAGHWTYAWPMMNLALWGDRWF